MKPSDDIEMTQSDPELDEMLAGFFQAELPELPPLVLAPALAPPASASASRRGFALGFVTALAAAILVSLWAPPFGGAAHQPVLQPVPIDPGVEPGPVATDVPIEREEPIFAGWQVQSSDNYQPLQRVSYQTQDGEIVRDTGVRWRTVRVHDPQTGSYFEWTAPDLRIDLKQQPIHYD